MKTIIKNPRITEKGTHLESVNAYLFDVGYGANKDEVKRAIFSLYKVRPVKVNMLRIPEKKMNSRAGVGVKSGGRKAVVYLKKGDKIEFV